MEYSFLPWERICLKRWWWWWVLTWRGAEFLEENAALLGWEGLAGSLFLQPSDTVVGKRCEGGPCASPWPWGITSLLSLKVWSVGKCSRRGTGFFLAPWGSASLGCMSCCLLPPARSAGLPLQEEQASLCCMLPKADYGSVSEWVLLKLSHCPYINIWGWELHHGSILLSFQSTIPPIIRDMDLWGSWTQI